MARFRRAPVDRHAEKEAAQRRLEDGMAKRVEWRRQVDRENTGEARGFRYAIECGVLWLQPDGKHGLEPHIFDGDRESSQARACQHGDKNNFGGGVHHTPAIYPEAMVADRSAFLRSWDKR